MNSVMSLWIFMKVFTKEGSLSLSIEDTDGAGKVNIWQTYRDKKPLKRSIG